MFHKLILRTLVTNCGINGLGLINSILLAHWLGPSGRGEVAAALLWPMLLAYLSSMGLISATLYFSARPNSQLQAIFTNGVALAVIQSSAAVLVGYFGLPFLLHSQSPQVILAARTYLCVIPITLVGQYGTSILQGRLHMTAYNCLRLIIPVGYLVGVLFLAEIHRLRVLNIVILHVGLNLAMCIATLVALFSLVLHARLQTDATVLRQMLHYGVRIQVGNVAGLANQNLDQAVMAAWLAPTFLGLYVVAVSSAAVSRVFSETVLMVSMPNITQRENGSERANALQRIFRGYWLISLPLTLIVAAFLPIAVPLFFGASFKVAVWPAEILLVGVFLAGAKDVLATGAQALGNPWLGSKAQLGGFLVTGLFLYLLLPMMGIVGAAIATSAACLIQLLIVVVDLRRTHGIASLKLFQVKAADLVAAFHAFRMLRAPRGNSLTAASHLVSER